MFYVMNSETKQIRTFAGRDSQFAYRKVAEKYAAKANRSYYRNSQNCYVVISVDDYRAAGYSNLTHKVVNLMTGQEVEESINTPYCCSVSSETYWSM